MQETPGKDIQIEKTDFLKRLRNHTQALHTGLEQHPISTALFHPNVTQTDYTRYLQTMYAIVSRFEKAVFPLLASFLGDIDQRRKTELLEKDLRYLNGWSERYKLSSGNDTATDTASLGYLMGKMYVLEGSTLGGAVIYKQLQPILGFTPEKGGTYFYGYGSQTGPMWKVFMDRLSALAIEKNETEPILKGAADQFAALAAFFDTRL
ncbi:MAG: biliverdin-producing heme oxygenase [Spirosomataceae bacterium]